MENDIEVDLEEDAGLPRIYEVSYLLVPDLEEGQIKTLIDELKAAVSKDGGSVLNEGIPKLIALAYQMSKTVANKKNKYTNAHFGWLKFEIASDKTAKVKKLLDGNDNIIRHLIIKTSKESPITQRPSIKRRPAPVTVKKEVKEEPKEVDEAQLDKEIEELLTS